MRHASRLALALPLALGACVPQVQHARHRAAAAPVVLRHIRPATDSAAAVPRARLARIGVVVAPEARVTITGGLVSSAQQADFNLSPAERDALAARVADVIRALPALQGVRVTVLPGGAVAGVPRDSAAFAELDALCIIGFEQSRRTSNSRFWLLELALLAPPFVLPTVHGETLTTVEVVGVRLADGRPLFRAGATSRLEGRAAMMRAGAPLRAQRLRGLHDAVAALAPELARTLGQLEAARGDAAARRD